MGRLKMMNLETATASEGKCWWRLIGWLWWNRNDLLCLRMEEHALFWMCSILSIECLCFGRREHAQRIIEFRMGEILFIELIAIAPSNRKEGWEDTLQEYPMWNDSCFHETCSFRGWRSDERSFNAKKCHSIRAKEADANSNENHNEEEAEISWDHDV